MFLRRNFVWTLDLSDRELKVIIKLLRNEDLNEEEDDLAEKLSESIYENSTRLERICAGRTWQPRPLQT